MAKWDAKQYIKFEAERTRPVHDLVERILLPAPRELADLGCGPGNSTKILADRYPNAHVIGIDKSENMLQLARIRNPHLQFLKADIRRWRLTRKFDILLSSSAIQWIGSAEILLPRLVSGLQPGGCLALQVPDTANELINTVLLEVLSIMNISTRNTLRTGSISKITVDELYRILSPLMVNMDLWMTTYIHPLKLEDIVEWALGSGLQVLLSACPSSIRNTLMTLYRERLQFAYPEQHDGRILFAIPRLFAVAQKPLT
jgi:trans-aconitate 2-methyltransferase